MLVGTSAPETYSKFGLHLRRLARVRHACWYVRSNACWYVLEKKFSVPFRCLRRSLALRIFFRFMFFKFAYVPVIVFLYVCPIESQAAAYISRARTYVRAREIIATYVCMRAQMFFARAYICAVVQGNRYICMRAQMFGICCPLWILLSKTRKSFESVVCFGFSHKIQRGHPLGS